MTPLETCRPGAHIALMVDSDEKPVMEPFPDKKGTKWHVTTGSLPLQPARLLAPLYGSDWNAQPSGTFTSRLSTDRSPSPLLDITTTATGLLVWGFFCQELSAERPNFLPSSVSLFDLKGRFFVSDRKPSRAGAVKAGRLFGDHPAGLGVDSSEHGCTVERRRAGSAR